ncbi:unnamed protein product [Cylindrotheca closterium]|uniref:C3H1-type domain-containing protein n=1 Tax=Cylindrotheca closterium TaxID=2856 RepID=A0AAD2FJG4_9STRA|nr:unnamed protein product [Cylindrotheca closterium]
MPRGKNYVNNNRGVFLQASKKNKQIMRQCEYGSACNRPDCIYQHDNVGTKTDEVCLQFLAGTCAFATGGCRKRHPNKDEKDRLLRKYKRVRCHFGDDCHTEGCLYLHPKEMKPIEPAYIEPMNMDAAFPALGSAQSKSTTTTMNTPKTEPLPPSPWNNTAPQQQPMMQQNMLPMNQPNMSNIPMAPAWFPQDPSFAPFSAPPPTGMQNQQQQQEYYEYGDGGTGYDYGGAGYGYCGGSEYDHGGYNNNDINGYDMGAPGEEMPAPQMAPPSFNAGAKEFVPGGFSS